MTTPFAPLRAFALCGLLALALPTASCGQAPPAAPAAAPPPPTLADIDQLIGTAACQRDSECRVVGIGARACGGPEGYRAWSTTQTDGAALAALVQSQAQARKLQLERAGELSTCEVRPAPGVRCAISGGAGRCTLVPGVARGAV